MGLSYFLESLFFKKNIQPDLKTSRERQSATSHVWVFFLLFIHPRNLAVIWLSWLLSAVVNGEQVLDLPSPASCIWLAAFPQLLANIVHTVACSTWTSAAVIIKMFKLAFKKQKQTKTEEWLRFSHCWLILNWWKSPHFFKTRQTSTVRQSYCRLKN